MWAHAGYETKVKGGAVSCSWVSGMAELTRHRLVTGLVAERDAAMPLRTLRGRSHQGERLDGLHARDEPGAVSPDGAASKAHLGLVTAGRGRMVIHPAFRRASNPKACWSWKANPARLCQILCGPTERTT